MAPQTDSNNAYDDDQASTNYKEAFSLFDKRGTGRVALESLGDLLRACGQNPTLAEIKELEKGIGGDCKNTTPTLAMTVMLREWKSDANQLMGAMRQSTLNLSPRS